MSNTILVIGESGVGKSTSIKSLNPEETFIINVLGKMLPFKSANKAYKPFNKENPTGNIYSTDNADTIKRLIASVDKNRPEIKNLIIDDYQYVMCNEYMNKALEKGFDKFSLIGQNAWSIIQRLTETRNDLFCFVLSHSETEEDGRVKCKTIGKMIDRTVCLEGMFYVVLHALVRDEKYKFLTQNDGKHLAKSPMGMFNDRLIDNDLNYVKEKISEYINEDIDL